LTRPCARAMLTPWLDNSNSDALDVLTTGSKL
jgi:hypothetical protein